MTKMGIDTAALHAAIIPALGVVPPSNSASHNSNRRAPPRSAARDDATESTQASTRTGASSVITGHQRRSRAVPRLRGAAECHHAGLVDDQAIARLLSGS